MILLRSLVFNLLFYGWSALLGIGYLPLFVLPRRYLVAGGRLWARGAMAMAERIVGLGYRLRGRDNIPAGPVIYAFKHQSAWDTIVIPLLVDDPAIVLKRELTWIPFYGWYLLRTGMISVDRAGAAAALRKMIHAAKARTAGGRSIVIYPEGTRTKPGAHQPYQVGVAALYKELGLPVVPVALNSGRFWPRRSLVRRPGTIVVEFLPPIPPGLPRARFMAALETEIETACRRLDAEAAGTARRAGSTA